MMNISDILKIGVGLGVVLGLYELSRKLPDIRTEKLDPSSDKNYAYEFVNGGVELITGDDSATLGTKAYDAVECAKNGFGAWGECNFFGE